MEQQVNKPQLNIDMKNTTAVKTPDGDVVFQQGMILRQVSKFVAGTDEDAIMPLPVFYDVKTGKILKDTIPPDLREEYSEYCV